MIRLECYSGRETERYLDEVASWRLRHFREYPYLYAGSFDYERKYLQGIVGAARSLLVLAREPGGATAAISTGVPLASEADIVGDAPAIFGSAGYDAREFYYFGETIVAPGLRRQGLARRIFELQESRARDWGYSQACLAVVVREKDDPRRPASYQDLDAVWRGMGYTRTELEFSYDWPTIQADGSVVEQGNPMVFWTKGLSA